MATIQATSIENLQVLIRTGSDAFVSDEPPDIGDGLGPDPYEFLLSALGSCTVMTLQLYARRKEWPLEKVDIQLTHNRIHASDCDDCEQEEGFVEQIEVKLRVEGNLDEKQRERLAYIATRCPVHKTLTAAPRIVHTMTS